MQPQSFVFIGRAGSGKGTQAKLLIDVLSRQTSPLPVLYIETGAEFRRIAKLDTFAGRRTKEIIDQGSLMPAFMCVYAWGDIIFERYTGKEHMVFDGTPRKLEEARMFESVFPFLNLPKPWVVYLDVDHDESTKRLRLRAKEQGRKDDSDAGIRKRLEEYENQVKPTVDWYRGHSEIAFLDIDGKRSIDEVHQDIVKKLGLS